MDNVHIKTMPKKYQALDDVMGHLTDLKTTRLNDGERFGLEVALFIRKIEDIHVKRLVKDLKPGAVYSCVSRTGEEYYTVKLGMYEVRCGKNVYNVTPENNRFEKFVTV